MAEQAGPVVSSAKDVMIQVKNTILVSASMTALTLAMP
jgi:hypothetical protein